MLDTADVAVDGLGAKAPPAQPDGGTSALASRPTLVEHGAQRYLIMDAPRDENLHVYLRACKQARVTDLVRVCAEKTYSADAVEAAGIRLHEMPFNDGECPQPDVVDDFLRVVRKTIKQNGGGAEAGVAVHCVAGLGRAPVLVAIALVEFTGMDPVEAVAMIRKQRRGGAPADSLQQYEPAAVAHVPVRRRVGARARSRGGHARRPRLPRRSGRARARPRRPRDPGERTAGADEAPAPMRRCCCTCPEGCE